MLTNVWLCFNALNMTFMSAVEKERQVSSPLHDHSAMASIDKHSFLGRHLRTSAGPSCALIGLLISRA